ncbi:MAG TPA: DUF86 domain-containing protein [Bacillales bacterium]|nr:DUF86 domain-containing protein [Bacillales bacterium]
MYFVDRGKMEEILAYMETCIRTFDGNRDWQEFKDQLALERLAHVLIESVIDVGNQMIDGFIMRDPGSYADIIDILCDEKVITQTDGGSLKKLIEERKELVRSYTSVDHSGLSGLIEVCLPALKAFPGAVRRYLEEELGPVSAFKHQEEQENRE